MKTSKFSDQRIISILKQNSEGIKVADIVESMALAKLLFTNGAVNMVGWISH